MAMLVRSRTIESDCPPAGAFRDHTVVRGIPSGAYRAFGTYCVDTEALEFALTYDDGPDPESTPGVLDMLQNHNAIATFFVLSGAASRHPDIVRRIVADGHEVALHGIDHRSLLTVSTAEARRMISESRDTVENIIGQPVRLYRPPYGQHTLPQALAIRRLGLELLIWSGHATDWVDAPAAEVADRAIARVFPGAILLMHDTRADPETLEPGERLPAFDRGRVLDRILTSTRERGYRERTVSDLLARHPRVKSITRERMHKQ